MSYKCVCDLCGMEARQDEFLVPFLKTNYIENGRGVKIKAVDITETCKLNFCDKHYHEIGAIIRSLGDKQRCEVGI